MLSKSLISIDSIILKNLITRNDEKDQWYSATGYGFVSYYYDGGLALNHLYYMRADYKFTTTNQSPTWASMYIQGGGYDGPRVDNPVAGTEYSISLLRSPLTFSPGAYPMFYGTFYNGPSSSISGVTSYWKNMVVYDVTELYSFLRAIGQVTNDTELKTWCDTFIPYSKNSEPFSVASVFSYEPNDKIAFKDGNAVAKDFVTPEGMAAFIDCGYSSSRFDEAGWNAHFRKCLYFDGFSQGDTDALIVYNNLGNGNVTRSIVDAASQNSPFLPEHPNILKIVTSGTATPSAGGILYPFQSSANKRIVYKVVAKIPVGYYLKWASNNLGTGSTKTYPDNAGTGEWKEYTCVYQCGSSGTFQDGGYMYLDGTDNTSVTWYVAYVCAANLTDHPELQYWTALPNKTVFKNDRIFCEGFDTVNLIPNGDGSDSTVPLPTGYSWDSTDVAGNAKASYSIAVGTAGQGYSTPKAAINPYCRYRLSGWVKCKGDMSSFLCAIRFYDENYNIYTHENCVYRNSTKSALTQTLNPGDTVVKIGSTSNWLAGSFRGIGFRQYDYAMRSMNDALYSAGWGSGACFSITDSTTLTLNTAYSGTAIPAGWVAINSYAGSNYVYPLGKADLPTDNTWKYFEFYIGHNDGRGYDGDSAYSWEDYIPIGARYMDFLLNFYVNSGTVPIKYSDLRFEAVSKTTGANRYEGKILFKKHSYLDV